MLKLLTGKTATHQWHVDMFLSFLPPSTENVPLLTLTCSRLSILSTCTARPVQRLPRRPSPTWSPSTLAKPPFFFLRWRDIFASCNQTTWHPATENNRNNNTVTLLNYITREHCPANTLVDWNSGIQDLDSSVWSSTLSTVPDLKCSSESLLCLRVGPAHSWPALLSINIKQLYSMINRLALLYLDTSWV